jgi:PAS domain-containing protein
MFSASYQPSFERPHRLQDHEHRLLDILARQAGDYLASRRAEQALRAATASLRVTTENMTAAVARGNRKLRYVWVSKAYAEWLGRSVDDITGQAIVDVIKLKRIQLVL